MAAKDILYEYDENFQEDQTGYWKLTQEGSQSCPTTGTLLIPGKGLSPLLMMMLSFVTLVGVTYNVENGGFK